MTRSWYPDEQAHAGAEHLDPAYVETYDAKTGLDLEGALSLLLRHGLAADTTLVDLGCGTGLLAAAASAEARRVVGVDPSPAMLDVARRRDAAVEWVEAGLLSYEHEGDPPQLVHSRHALHHLPDFWKGVALARVHDLLAPGGVLVLCDLVYDFEPAEHDNRIEDWLAGAAPTPEEGWTRGELEAHVHGEHSTFSWLLEDLLAPVKKRLDVVLVERGLAESRAQAQALVLAGLVRGYDKPGQQVAEDAELEVDRPPPYVSRGGEKLAHGLDGLDVDPAGLDCVDVGASTGGFTDVLLQRGAARVVALDVGYGQLHPRLRSDPRVTVLERTNARTLTGLPFRPQLAVCDVSFISVRLALPPVLRLCTPAWQAVVLVKPQFEAGRADVGKGGVVRDPEVRRRVVLEVAEAALSWGATVRGVVDSGLPGPKGNREMFLHLEHSEHPTLPDDLDARIEHALAG